MGRRNPISQLGVYAKKVNDETVGFILGFGDNNRPYSSIRANCIFQTMDEAIAVLESIENNTQTTHSRITYDPVKLGKERARDGWIISRRDS